MVGSKILFHLNKFHVSFSGASTIIIPYNSAQIVLFAMPVRGDFALFEVCSMCTGEPIITLILKSRILNITVCVEHTVEI